MEPKTFRKLLQQSLKEMEKNQTVLLTRGDKIRKEDIHLYNKVYQALKDVLQRVAAGEDASQMIQQKNIFVMHESFFMDLFETHRFPRLFKLFEYVGG